MKIPTLSLALASMLVPTDAALSTEYLSANGLNFTCTVLDHTVENAEVSKDIMLLHGFPMFRVWWDPLLNFWNEKLKASDGSTSVRAVACDLRGYSPGASPDGVENYHYDIFASDTFALAEAAGFDQGFHLLGHDHGAGLAWYMADNDPDDLILSLTTLSVPHIGLMSQALCGDNVDEDQVIASNYFNQFSLVDSATVNNATLTSVFQAFGFGDSLQPHDFQKMLWWYNGSLAESFSLPRVVSDEEVAMYAEKAGPQAGAFLGGVRLAVPMEERECTQVSEEDLVGAITVPTLFICGLGDVFLLCNNTYATDFPPELLPDYEHANFACGHDFFLPGDCSSTEESQLVMDKITSFVLPSLVENGNETESNPPMESTDSPTATPNDSSSQRLAPIVATGLAAVMLFVV